MAEFLASPLPFDGPVGEAWVLSDREDHPSCVANGPLKGRTIRQLINDFPEQLMGELATGFRRFPLLLKFLDVHEMLSVQVHPGDERTDLLPGKRERPKPGSFSKLARQVASTLAGALERPLRTYESRSRKMRCRITSYALSRESGMAS